MLNRSKRDSSENTQNFNEKYHIANGRKFGNIMNRLQKPSRSPISKTQHRDSYYGIENGLSQQLISSNKKQNAFGENSYNHVAPFEPNISQATNNNMGQIQKKESDKRNRQFVTKVENINKMHEQISSLLKYVKNGQSKSVCKQKDITDNRSVTTKSIQNIIKQRINTSQINEKYLDFQKLNEQSQIVPITQGERQIRDPPNKSKKSYLQRAEMDSFNPTNNKKQVGVDHYKPRNNSRTGQLNYRIYNQKNQNHLYPQQKQNLNKKAQISHALIGKNEDIEDNFQKKQMQRTKKINKFIYNFDSKQSQIKQFVNKSQLKKKEGKYEKNAIDYDYEIEKVRERIEDSQKMTKKMQQKYLLSHENKYINSIADNSKISRQQINKNGMQKMNKSTQDFQKKYGRKSYLNYQQHDTKTERTHNFEIKIHPCKSQITVQEQKQGKDQINRIIALKLSDQVKLDQKLRDARQIFNNCKAQNKWKLLQQRLEELGYSYSQEQLQKQLVISSNQSNPFQNQSYNSIDSINILAQAFVNSEEFWERKLSKFISKSRLQGCGYLVKQMDLDQRGYLTVQDLVCFINLYSSNFFRNRDLICLFRRMMALGKSSHGIQYQCFLNIISSQ